MMKQSLAALAEGKDLGRDLMVAVMNGIMEGEATPAQIGAFLMGLRVKGETVEEITGAAQVMREKAKRITAPGPCIDTCGTGGDNSLTFNISTTAAFVVAGAGLIVAKHGNRAASSACGSADVLAALGVNIEADVPLVEHCLREAGIGFLFAPLLHGAMRFAIGPRREMGTRTIFNVLGPLTNPAGAKRQLLGVFSGRLTEPLARVLGNLGSEAALVVHGEDGLDEITLTAETRVSELKDGQVKTYSIKPEDFGFKRCHKDDLLGGAPEDNARIARQVLDNAPGPRRDVIALNAGAAIYAAGKADTIALGVKIALAAIASGAAAKKLELLVQASRP
ncbi:MAG TPA: anthranilate phosphoribosyltransferase [bacterium]|nr:anthranilate phosphoribosyltransferase [bacterium]